MLFTRLQRHAEALLAEAINGNADDAAREVPLVRLACSEKRRVRSAIAHGHTKPLAASNHHIGIHGTGVLEERERHGVSGHNSLRFDGMSRRDDARHVLRHSAGIRVLQENTENGVVELHFCPRHEHEVDAEVLGAGPEEGERLGEHGGVDEEAGCAGFGLCPGHGRMQHRHRLCRSRRLIQQRSIRKRHPCQVADHRLEVQQRLEPALRNFCLVRRVRRVPTRVFQHIPTNDAGHLGRVVTHPDVVAVECVALTDGVDVLEEFRLGHRCINFHALPQANRPRNRVIQQVLHRSSADGAEHRLNVLLAGADVAVGKGAKLHQFQPIRG